jgi:hemolysin activation/secretion protein
MFVRYAVTVALLALLGSAPASADYDAAEEAREKAQRDASQRAEQQKQQEMQRQKREAEAKYNAAVSAETMKSRRKTLGAAADGKTDAEVNRLYDAKLKKDDEAIKSVTGKSMKDMEKMSDAELEALARELQKKYK